MVVTVLSSLVRGLEGRLVEVQVDVSNGTPGFALVGLASSSVKEAKERVRAAIRNCELPFPAKRLTVNLAPAVLRKEGSSLDLALAVGICAAETGLRPPPATAYLGELSLDGAVRHVQGVLVAGRGMARHGIDAVFVGPADAEEARLAGVRQVYPSPTLGAVMGHLMGRARMAALTLDCPPVPPALSPVAQDLAEVHGQEAARRALEVAAAGGHHLLMTGPPGAGKTMLARCLPGLLPPMALPDALELAQVRSVLGELPAQGPLDWLRPFRDPHHSVSLAGLVGGGSSTPGPGEISRAHHGVLFLDELAEFHPATLQALRQPLEQGQVVITRRSGAITYPARFQLVAATNPCPCGWSGDQERPCRCKPAAIDTYQRALSGPLLDRIDLQVVVPRTPLVKLAGGIAGEASAPVRGRVLAARDRQLDRQACLNGDLRPPDLRRLAALDGPAASALHHWAEVRGLSARGFHRAWRIARTLADMDGADRITEDHVLEALGYRLGERAA